MCVCVKSYLPSVLIHVLPFINHLKITLKVQTDSRACRIYFPYKVLFLRKKTKEKYQKFK